ncbi:unannotated protein [freshwater metagenome]|uniref:Unannotated protein n=1 Tax=freshwater metagenome TaxID=449393 RepID=A0A6J7MK33_9ZZZZ
MLFVFLMNRLEHVIDPDASLIRAKETFDCEFLRATDDVFDHCSR